MEHPHDKPRSLWTSRIGFILVTAGAAVGLGNIWKFPYLVGVSGGAAFVLLYLLFTLFVGIPAMVAELIIGRHGRQNAVNSLETLAREANHSPRWQSVGWLGACTLLLVLSFYSVVSGWSIAYLGYNLQGFFIGASPSDISSIWQTLLDAPLALIGWHSVFMLLTMLVVALGINRGIERASRWMMPSLFLILIFLVIAAAIEGDFWAACHFLFSFDVSQINTQTVINAMGQAFFSLATGAGAILVYGSYLSKKTAILNTVFIISGLNVLVALLAGLAIFPIVFAHGLAPESGPGLMYIVLPIALSHMPGSAVIGGCFFILLIFAAWTSSISMGEPLVALLHERWGIRRRKGALYVGLAAWSLGLLSVFSFNVLSSVKILHRWGLFQILTDLPTNLMLPIGAFLFCIFGGWIMDKKSVQEEFGLGNGFLYQTFLILIRYIAPVCILIVLIAGLIGY